MHCISPLHFAIAFRISWSIFALFSSLSVGVKMEKLAGRVKFAKLTLVWRGALWLALATGVIGALIALSPLGWKLEESVGLDWLFQFRGARAPPSELVIVGVDRQSAQALGQTPQLNTWPRTLHAELIEKLVAAGAALIVFDIYFGTTKKEDAEFARAIITANRVVLFEQSENTSTAAGPLTRLNPPVDQLRTAARGTAPFPLPKIPVRVSRHWSFFNTTPTLPVVALQILALDFPEHAVMLAEAGLATKPTSSADDLRRFMASWRDYLKAKPERADELLRRVPAQSTSYPVLQALLQTYAGPDFYFLNFYGPPATLSMVPYHKFWGESSLPDLRGKVVFVGSMDPTHYEQPDQFLTVFSTDDGIDLSGVEVVATAFANLLGDTTLRYPAANLRVVLLLALGGLLGVLMYSIRSPWLAASTVLIAASVYTQLAQWLFTHYEFWLPLAVPLLVQLPFVIIAGLYCKYAIYRRAMRRYVPKSVADTETSGSHPPAPVAAYGVCLCSDVAGYTTISERLLPEDLVSLNSEYFATLGECVHKHGGEMLDITGDGMMCVWPSAQPSRDACRKACLAALDIQRAVEQFNARHSDFPFPTRIGLHAGWLALGHMGGDGHYIYGVAGDVPNTASRIEGLNKHTGTLVLAERSVVKGLDDFLMRRLGQFQLKGKRDVLTIFELAGLKPDVDSAEEAWYPNFEKALDLYEAGDWQGALDRFQVLEREHPGDKPSQFYRIRCQEYLAAPPSGEFHIISVAVK